MTILLLLFAIKLFPFLSGKSENIAKRIIKHEISIAVNKTRDLSGDQALKPQVKVKTKRQHQFNLELKKYKKFFEDIWPLVYMKRQKSFQAKLPRFSHIPSGLFQKGLVSLTIIRESFGIFTLLLLLFSF